MEQPVSVLRQRATSFNPEAAAFSPIFGDSSPQDVALAPATSPPPLRDFDYTFAMAPMFNYSPFHDVASARSLYCRDPLTSVPVRLEDILSPDVQALVKKLEKQPDVEEIRAPQTPRPAAAPVAEANRTPTPRLPPFTFPEPTPEPQPDFTLVGISELSAGLGLPSVKADASGDASTTASHESRAHPGALYGKLIGWALEKPLTAKGLADFLQKQDTATPTKPPALSSVTPTKTVPQTTETTPKKSPPRLAKPKDTSTPRCVAAPAPNETITTPKGPSAQHQHRRSSVSTTSHHLHSRMPSHRRFPRRASRTKRMDQGPMPSSADIYPDDAHPPLPTHEHAHPCYPPATPIIANPFNWPPPAQAYAPEPPPSLADMHAADTDVLALIHEMPQPSLCTLVRLGNSHDLRATGAVGSRHALDGDARALSPAQRDGSRYGIRFWGIGYGDSWEVGVAGTFEQSEQFRVRPREHEGWGGRQWARVRGWGA